MILINKYKILIITVTVLFLGFICIVFLNISIQKNSKSHYYADLQQVTTKETILILGAKVYDNGRMSDMFSDRVKTAIELYSAGKGKKILVSGDHGKKDYDEVNAAKKYLLEQNVRAEDIFLDHAGFDTYDSLYRARDIFQVKSLIIVTQDFHLPRSLYIGKGLGLDVVGFSADKQLYRNIERNKEREFIANIKAFIDLTFRLKPKYLGEIIPITGNNAKSWE